MIRPSLYFGSLWFGRKGRLRRRSPVRSRCSVSETRCNDGAFRDRSSRPWPNISLQARALSRLLCSGTATGHNTAGTFAERFGASANPGHGNLATERVCVLPFRDPGEQDVRQGVYRDVFTTFPEGQNTDTRPRWSARSRKKALHPELGITVAASPLF